MAGCAAPRPVANDTWITPRMTRVYCQIHALGHAHSVEVWQAGQLVGGLYGVSRGGFFAGESMFHRLRDASKVALVTLVAHLKARGFSLFDVQQATQHAVRMGATEIGRSQFITRLRKAVEQSSTFGSELDLSLLPSILHRP
jgi:leucyl/phenylalanyl-tRNA--protein transferase